MLTAKGKYGIKAMIHLARLAEGEIAQVSDIAESNNIPKKFLDQIFADLRKAGLVYSKKGKAGGYALAKAAHDIGAGQIIRILDGPLAPIQCASVTAYRPCDDCDCVEDCEVRLLMTEVRNAISVILDKRSLHELAYPKTRTTKKPRVGDADVTTAAA